MRTPLLLLALTGCDALFGDDKADDPTSPPTTTTDPATPTLWGDASITFEPRWGGEAGDAFQINIWRPVFDGNLYVADGHALVWMLCETDDPTCLHPLAIREVSGDETDGDPVQRSFGPAVTVTGLPEGDFLFMVFADSAISRELGFAWDDSFETTEQKWGGRLSEFDAALASEVQSAGFNPPIATLPVSLGPDNLDLGVLELQHFHERDVSPPVPTENGAVAVAVSNGVRMVDLSSFTVEDAPGFLDETHVMLDDSDEPVSGSVCGMVDGGDGLIWLLYTSVSDAFAVPFDATARAQVGRSVVRLPNNGDNPCRGIAADLDGQPHLLVTNAGASRHGEADAAEGLWVADVSNMAAGNVTARFYDQADDDLFAWGVDDMVVVGDTLYLSITAQSGDRGAPDDCLGRHCVFEAGLAEAGLNVTPGGDYRYTSVLDQNDSLTTADGVVGCTNEHSWAGLTFAPFHDGRDLLFVGGCTQIAVIDLAADALIDMDSALVGHQNLDSVSFGQAYNAFSLSPDGQTLWALPQEKSAMHFYIEKGVGGQRQTYNRYMVMPIDLGSGSAPGLDAGYATGNIDGWDGPTDIGDVVTPADDPGVDLNFGHYVVHQLAWAPDTGGSTFQSASFPVGPSLVAASGSLWIRGSGVPGVSGLGKAGDLEVIDLASRRPLLFSATEDVYPFWTGGADGTFHTGFSLTPGSEQSSSTYGLAYIP